MTEKFITLGIFGLAIYLAWEWLVNQCETPGSGLYGGATCGAIIGTQVSSPTAIPASVSTTTAAAPVQAPAVNPLVGQLMQAAGDPNSLGPDQWSFYYNNLQGKTTIQPATFEAILGSLGLSDATRAEQVTAQQFVTAANANGIWGIGRVPASAIHGGAA